ncbi:MAG: glycosyltransferase family 2 protein [Patescibacteria group bacterium]
MAADFLIILILSIALGLGLIYLPWLVLILLVFIFLIVLLQGSVELIASFLPYPTLKFSNSAFDRFVSIHVPSFNEPTDILKNTLKHLSLLEYKNYEVIIVDNNTVDEAVWKPIEKYCRELGNNFKFFHIDKLEGFKAGALNFAQEKTNPKAEFIVVVDADYEVKPQFLKEALSYFVDEVAFVQFPQAYKNITSENKGIAVEYEHFFKIYMKMANHFNCVPSTGTLVIFRRNVLNKIGFYDKKCLTEDAEIGTRLIEAGRKGVYVDKVMGLGLMPYDIEAYKKQKLRWAFGNAQILKKDIFRILFGNKLGYKQKISFFSEMTAWFNFTLIPMLVIFLGSIIYNISKISILISVFTIYLFFAIKLVSFGVTFRKEYSAKNVIKALFVHFGMVAVYSIAFIKSFLNMNFSFERTNKFILPQKPSILKNTSTEIFMTIIGSLVSLNYFINSHSFLAVTTFLIAINYLLIFYVYWEISPIKKYSSKLINEMEKSMTESKIGLK